MSYALEISSIVAIIGLVASAYLAGLRIGNSAHDSIKSDLMSLRLKVQDIGEGLARIEGVLGKGE
mgnify:FL=1|jgi:hypothetical protein